MNELRKRLGDKRVIAALAFGIVAFLWLRSRGAGSAVTSTSTLPVDPTTGQLPADASVTGFSPGLTADDLSPIQASLEGGLGDLAAQLAQTEADLAGQIQGAFVTTQNANDASQLQGPVSSPSPQTEILTSPITPSVTSTATSTSTSGAPAGIPAAFTIAGGLDPAIATAFAARNKPVAFDSILPRATQPPMPIPVNVSPAPAPPVLTIAGGLDPAIATAVAATATPAPAPAPPAPPPPPSLIALHLAHGRDPGF